MIRSVHGLRLAALIACVALVACAALAACGGSSRAHAAGSHLRTAASRGTRSASGTANPIAAENALPGTTAWQLRGPPSTAIAGYASQMSVRPGDTLQLHVSTSPAASYRVEIYRLGWYGGAGGRLITCLPGCTTTESGSQQPVPASAWLGPRWPVTDSVTVGPDWTTGYYVAKLVLSSGAGSYVYFIVRPAPGANPPILVQASVNTWEAYNDWGGKSLYPFNSSGNSAATQVSFQRPLNGSSSGGQTPFAWEYSLVRYLERAGYDVGYQTDIDTDESPGSLLGHKLDIVNGHDEYWSLPMRSAWTAARKAGVNLAFLGGDIGSWHARYGNRDSTLYEYRTAAADPNPNPAQKTVLFTQLGLPECQLLGVSFLGGLKSPTGPPDNYTVTAAGATSTWFAATGLGAGQRLFDAVGYEWETIEPGCSVPRVTDLLHFSGSPANADAVSYVAPSGATVFSDGTLQLAWALDGYGHSSPSLVDGRVQALFANIFDSLGGGPPGGTPDQPPTAFNLLSPRQRAVVWTPRPTLRWSHSGDPDGKFAGYAVLLDGRTVAVTMATSYTPPRSLGDGTHTWLVKARDAIGNTVSAGPSSFRVSSIRLLSLSRRHIVGHGFVVEVFCLHRCTIAGTLILARHGPTLSFHGRGSGARVTRLGVALTPAFARALAAARRAQVAITVLTRIGRTTRRVHVIVRLSG